MVWPTPQAVKLDLGAWPLVPVFSWIKGTGRVTEAEMLRTFNCGLGMVVIVAADKVDAAMSVLAAEGEGVYRIGSVVEMKQAKVEDQVQVTGALGGSS